MSILIEQILIFLEAWGDQICSDMLSLIQTELYGIYVRFEITDSFALALYWDFFRKKQSSEYKGNESGHTVIANGALLDYQV